MDIVAEEGNGGLRSVCSVTFSAAEIGFAGLDERTNSLFVDKFSYSRESLFSIIESVRGGCNVGTWLIHPKHQDNPIVDFLYSSDDGGKGAAKKSVVEVVKVGVWRPEVAIDTVYKHLEVERIIVAQEENNGGLRVNGNRLRRRGRWTQHCRISTSISRRSSTCAMRWWSPV